MRFSLKQSFNRVEERIIFSIPQTNSYQQISKIKLYPSANITIVDEWGNEIVILNDVKNFSLSFHFQGKTFKVFKNKLQSFSITDYQKKTNQEKLSFFTQSNRFIHPYHPKIRALARKIVGQEKNLFQIVKKIYLFVLDYLIYDNPIEGLYSDLESLEKKKVDCGGFSTLSISILNSLNIPARLVVGFIIKKNFLKSILEKFYVLSFTFADLFIHAWLEVLLPDNSWFPIDPSIEWRRNHGLSKREGGFGIIPNDRLVLSYGCDLKYKIEKKKYHLDIIQKITII